MKAVLFDLDGTLIDTAADFIRIIQEMCREEQREVVDADLIRTQVSEVHVRWSSWCILNWLSMMRYF